jgi:hypothetical protein
VAAKKGILEGVKKTAATLSARIPFLPKRPAASMEPFAAIEDDTPLGDLLSSANAAPGLRSAPKQRLEPRALLATALKSPGILIALIALLGFGLVLIITSVIVNSPPRAAAAPPPFTEKGEALVRTWLPPPGDPFEAGMAMEREGRPVYSAEDAARLGLGLDPSALASLRDKNDEAIEDLYGTVP